jgi:beta-xylosidase
VLYYAAASNGPTINPFGDPTHCVRAAVADSPAGPFRALEKFLACPYRKGGAIDPYGFVDKDHSLYVAYKIDGNSIGHGGLCGNTVAPIVSTPIMLQRVMADGVTPDGYPVQILDRSTVDGPLVEAPAIIDTHAGTYYLLYSSGCTTSPTYDVRYAIADNISGPYKRVAEPLLSTGDWSLEAPGSVGAFKNGKGGWNMAFHARE